jgi:NAD-dependent DNA ligase
LDVKSQIERRRAQLLVHRFLYYVRSESLITDYQYDMWERELVALVKDYPDIAAEAKYADDCPTTKPGSSNIWDYPRELQHVADSILIYNPENLDWWAKVTDEENRYEIKAAEPVQIQRSIFD